LTVGDWLIIRNNIEYDYDPNWDWVTTPMAALPGYEQHLPKNKTK
jgi:hypothetical protein